MTVYHKDPLTGVLESDLKRDYEQKRVLRKARELSDLPNSMIPTKNLYENRLLENMLKSDADEKETN